MPATTPICKACNFEKPTVKRLDLNFSHLLHASDEGGAATTLLFELRNNRFLKLSAANKRNPVQLVTGRRTPMTRQTKDGRYLLVVGESPHGLQ